MPRVVHVQVRHPWIAEEAPDQRFQLGPRCDLRIDDPGVSRRHAEIRVHGSGPEAQLVVVDLGSTNGTVVDGVRAAQAPLSDGSRIVLGSTIVDVHRRVPRR